MAPLTTRKFHLGDVRDRLNVQWNFLGESHGLHAIMEALATNRTLIKVRIGLDSETVADERYSWI